MTRAMSREPAAVIVSPTRWSWANRFRTRQYLKGSLWFLPMLGGLLGPALAFADLAIEPHVQLPAGLTYSSDNAAGILTAIVGAMVGLLGFVVTIGVLVVQSATGTLSPRFMRLWYRDPLQKAVLATFAGTFTFAFTLLRRVDDKPVPSLGVSIAGALVTLSLLLLLVFLDRFTHVLRPVAVGSLMVRYGLAAMRVFPPASATIENRAAIGGGVPALTVCSGRAGVMQALHGEALFQMAERHQCRIVLTRTPGDFVAIGAPVAEVYGSGTLPDPAEIVGLLALGIERTIDQDPAFAMRILVDIAIRALSPAVNDPTTAVQMLNHIEVFIQAVAARGHLANTWTMSGADGRPRLIVPVRQFDDYLQLAMTEILDYGGGSTQVCRRLSALLTSLLDVVDRADRGDVEAQLSRLDAEVEAHFPPTARAFVREPDGQGLGGPGARVVESD